MSTGPDSPHLKASDLNGPLPWSFVVDHQLRITHVGECLSRHVEGIRPGVLFTDWVSIVQPACEISNLDDLHRISGRLVVMEFAGLSVQLRGAAFTTDAECACIMAAVPLIRSHAEFVESGLVINDFAPQDSVPDLLFALQARDVAFRESTESSLIREQQRERLKSILDSALDGMITIDDQGCIVEFNDVASDMFGHARDSAIGKELSTLIIPPALRAQHAAGMRHFRKTAEGPILNRRIEVMAMKQDGQEFPVEMAVIPFVHKGNQYFTATLRDLTAVREQQEALKIAAEQERLLGNELDHRVKNMLSQILVLCREAETNATSDINVIESLSRRIQNFSAVHELLSNERATGVDCAELTWLCLSPYVKDGSQVIEVDAPKCRFVPKAAMTLAMVLNELATNATKHGAILHCGQISVKWSIERGSETELKLVWREQHSGVLPESIAGGFGTQILQAAIPHELGGTADLQLEVNGLVYVATMPFDQVVQI
ncbi:MAG: PAS domain S-box protein [Phycisphaerales bacterium]|nr:PAS domain S-box protein [Phycisphaerales bacterium]